MKLPTFLYLVLTTKLEQCRLFSLSLRLIPFVYERLNLIHSQGIKLISSHVTIAYNSSQIMSFPPIFELL